MINFIQNSAHLILEAHGRYAQHGGVMNAPQSSYDMQKASSCGFLWSLLLSKRDEKVLAI